MVRDFDKDFRGKCGSVKLTDIRTAETKRAEGTARKTRKGPHVMMGGNTQQESVKCEDKLDFANKLNTFCARFDDRGSF